MGRTYIDEAFLNITNLFRDFLELPDDAEVHLEVLMLVRSLIGREAIIFKRLFSTDPDNKAGL